MRTLLVIVAVAVFMLGCWGKVSCGDRKTPPPPPAETKESHGIIVGPGISNTVIKGNVIITSPCGLKPRLPDTLRYCGDLRLVCGCDVEGENCEWRWDCHPGGYVIHDNRFKGMSGVPQLTVHPVP